MHSALQEACSSLGWRYVNHDSGDVDGDAIETFH